MKTWVIVLATLLSASLLEARETDQFTVPPQSLYDLGPDFDHRVEVTLQQVVNSANARYEKLLAKAAAASSPSARARYINDAAESLTDDYLLYQVYSALGRDDANAFTKSLGQDIHSNGP